MMTIINWPLAKILEEALKAISKFLKKSNFDWNKLKVSTQQK